MSVVKQGGRWQGAPNFASGIWKSYLFQALSVAVEYL